MSTPSPPQDHRDQGASNPATLSTRASYSLIARILAGWGLVGFTGPVLMIGLTGGIGSGKSVAARRFAELGALVIDSDRIAREVVEPGTDGLRAVVAAFGTRICRDDGSLDRAALGSVVFGDESARARLEGIIHPRVRARSAELVAAAGPDAIVVNDVPLLVEVGLVPTYHLVVVVETDQAVRVERLVRDRGMTKDEAYRRIRAQTDDARRRAAADVVLRNDGSLDDLRAAIDLLWQDRLVPYQRNLRERRPLVPTAPVRLVPADPTWPAQYARLAARIRHALRPAEPRIDHIGLTAVPDLDARDVIELQLTVDALDQADAFADRLADAGFPRCPGSWWDWTGRQGSGARWEKRLHGGADPGRPVLLHLRVGGSPGWRSALLLRDYLGADPKRVAGHRKLERRLATTGPDGASHTAFPVLDAEHRHAEQWAAEVGWQP